MSSSNIWMLAIGILAIVAMVVLTASARRVFVIGALIALIPFQVVETRFASSSVLMAYAVAGAMLLGGHFRVKLLPEIGLVLLAYMISFTQAKDYQSLHVIEMFQYFSCFVVFLLAYNYGRLVSSERSVVSLLLLINILVLAYCALQLSAGAGKAFVPFGIQELAFNTNRDPGDPRLIGPFGNPGSTAAYFTMMTLLWSAELTLASAGRKRLLLAVVLANVAALTATGNRASFLVLMAGLPVLLLTFRRELGPKRFFQFLAVGVASFMLATAAIVAYSGFGNMFRRLALVMETEDGLPMTRAGTWSMAFDKISQDPWFGEGPHYFRAEDAELMKVRRTTYEDLSSLRTTFDPYPHSLYLFLLRTVGIVGLAATLAFFAGVLRELRQALKRGQSDVGTRTVLKAGIVVIGAFLITQITLEFNRTTTMDYAQFILALMGLLVGLANRDQHVAGASRVATSMKPR